MTSTHCAWSHKAVADAVHIVPVSRVPAVSQYTDEKSKSSHCEAETRDSLQRWPLHLVILCARVCGVQRHQRPSQVQHGASGNYQRLRAVILLEKSDDDHARLPAWLGLRVLFRYLNVFAVRLVAYIGLLVKLRYLPRYLGTGCGHSALSVKRTPAPRQKILDLVAGCNFPYDLPCVFHRRRLSQNLSLWHRLQLNVRSRKR